MIHQQSGLLKSQSIMMNSSARLKLLLRMWINISQISIVLLITIQQRRSYKRKYQAIIIRLKLIDFSLMKKLTVIAQRPSLEPIKDWNKK
jgi:hypothetical protein